ncbi:uncharacterized protein ARMOST_18072 [Armillaria ostoyae]|uniref:Uncharacterized protein n=1 Tax=Armillaria ostoyae TaxID=47428 RepID=A0A284S0S1_ARMOS|nr:uncharacterized protein ARMOST_18072 [Armillaria ostoyae]
MGIPGRNLFDSNACKGNRADELFLVAFKLLRLKHLVQSAGSKPPTLIRKAHFNDVSIRYYLVFAICSHTNALCIWAFYPETSGRRLEEMDALFEDSPIFVPGSGYTKVSDRHAAENDLRAGNFVPGELTGREALGKGDEESAEHYEKTE